jgi:hypothetical protein
MYINQENKVTSRTTSGMAGYWMQLRLIDEGMRENDMKISLQGLRERESEGNIRGVLSFWPFATVKDELPVAPVEISVFR